METPLPPLPLENGCLLIDNSFLETYQTCSRATEYSRLWKRIAKEDKPSLTFGSAIHAALEWRYKNVKDGCPTIIDEEQMLNEAEKVFVEKQSEVPDEYLNFPFAQTIIQKYNNKYQNEPFKLLTKPNGDVICEVSFALPLFEWHDSLVQPDGSLKDSIPIIYTGRIDLPVMWDNLITILDHKTSGMHFGAQRFLEEQKMSNQLLGYCWSFEELTGMHVGAYGINGIRTKQPPKTKPRNGTIEDWWNEGYCRDISYTALEPNWKERWKKDTIETITRFLWEYSRGYLPMNGMYHKACAKYNGCQYKDICSVRQEKRVELLQDDRLFQNNTWSPLKD